MRSIGAVTSAQTLSVVGALVMMPSVTLGMVAAIADLKAFRRPAPTSEPVAHEGCGGLPVVAFGRGDEHTLPSRSTSAHSGRPACRNGWKETG